jgi:hypothetical protein
MPQQQQQPGGLCGGGVARAVPSQAVPRSRGRTSQGRQKRRRGAAGPIRAALDPPGPSCERCPSYRLAA